MSRPKIRLHVEHPLTPGQTVDLSREQSNYLFAVMRLSVGEAVALFNGQDGEWRAVVASAGKRGGSLTVEAQTAPQQNPPDLWLLFAPIKKARTDFIVEKAAELGAARILPVQTEFTNSERIRRDRLQAHAIEAAEQCGGTYVPQVEELRRLSDVLSDWPGDRHLIFADEALVGAKRALGAAPDAGKWAILIGPEGGFSDGERARLAALPFVTPISLGPRVLRADTAAVAAMTLWQAERGDWR
jgi:16S rRNA (uracil1498-N3)-methyltransferase